MQIYNVYLINDSTSREASRSYTWSPPHSYDGKRRDGSSRLIYDVEEYLEHSSALLHVIVIGIEV